MTGNYRALLVGILLLSTTGCDRLTKAAAQRGLSPADAPLSFFGGFFKLRYAENTGAFLSLGENLPRPVLPILSTLMLAAVFFTLYKALRRKPESNFMLPGGLALLASGSLGNIIDRVFNHCVVVDFMSLDAGHLQTGIFNVADIAILLGAALLALAAFRKPQRVVG